MAAESHEGLAEFSAQERRFLGGRGRLVLVGVVLALAVAYLIYAAFPGSTSYYLTVDELAAYDGEVDGRSFRVKGRLIPDTFIREEGSTLATFNLTSGGETIHASYNGVVPDLFFNSHSEVILHGAYPNQGVFEADSVSVLCPTKYQALEEVS